MPRQDSVYKAETRRSLGMVHMKNEEKAKVEEHKILFLDVGLSKKWAGVALNQMGRHEQRADLRFDPSVLRSKHPDFQSSPVIKHFNSSVPGAGLQLRIMNFHLWSSLPLPSNSSPSWQPMRITMVSFTLRQGRHTGACTGAGTWHS